ncbi:MAG: L-fuculokinase [Bacteroidales bacterium]
MFKKDIAVVLDCGATNLRVIAIDIQGQIVASYSMPNETDNDPYHERGRIWDLDKLWRKLGEASRTVVAQIDCDRIAGITVTTFGVDGTFVDKNGSLLYPVISWQCQRTLPIMNNIDKYLSLDDLYSIAGVYPYAFNTINKMIWFKENRPDVIDKAHRFLFIPSLLINRLTGMFANDATMLGTSMFAELSKRKPSTDILDTVGIDEKLLGDIGEAGQCVGAVNTRASAETGLPIGIPVFLAGHDTQFAIYGSGAELNQPVLSSGTWEILMARSQSFMATDKELRRNLTTEVDAVPGVYDIGQNWLGSGVLEWFSRNYYQDLTGDKLYETMIGDAEQVAPGASGLQIDPAFYDDGTSSGGGVISGLTINTTRGQIYRAFLESLAFRLREALEALEEAGNFKAESIICVGGGSKNRLWNQLRANVCGIPVRLIDQKETTVLGAALFVFAGAGLSISVDEARRGISYNTKIIKPNKEEQKLWNDLYSDYIKFKNKIK